MSIAKRLLFGILDAVLDANPLARRLLDVCQPTMRTSINEPAGMVIDLVYGFALAGTCVWSALPKTFYSTATRSMSKASIGDQAVQCRVIGGADELVIELMDGHRWPHLGDGHGEALGRQLVAGGIRQPRFGQQHVLLVHGS